MRQELFARARAGLLDDCDIEAQWVSRMELPGDYDLFVPSICCQEMSRFPGAALLLGNLVRQLEELARLGLFAREICCNAYSGPGLDLCTDLNLRQGVRHYDYGTMYRETLLESPEQTFLTRFPRLFEGYCKRAVELTSVMSQKKIDI